MKIRFWIRLLNRGYPHAILRKSFSTVSFHSRDDYLLKNPTPLPVAPSARKQIIPLVLTYSRQLVDNNIHTLFSNNLRLLTPHAHFSALRINKCWRAAPKLGASLVTFNFPKAGQSEAPHSPASPLPPTDPAPPFPSQVLPPTHAVLSQPHPASPPFDFEIQLSQLSQRLLNQAP